MTQRIHPGVLEELAAVKKEPPIRPNGGTTHSTPEIGVELSSSETVPFSIGIETIRVPEMTWDIIETIMPMLEHVPAPETKWYQSKVRDFEIFLIVSQSVAPDMTMERLKKLLTLKQANDLSGKLLDLLKLSGFTIPGEASAASGSTETLTVSSQELSEEDGQELLSGTKSNVQ